MTETSSILVCPKLQQPRHHNFCCVNCAYCVPYEDPTDYATVSHECRVHVQRGEYVEKGSM